MDILIKFAIYIAIISTEIAKAATKEDKPWILHSNLETIDRLEINTWSSRSLIKNQTAATAVDYHYKEGYIYWTDQIEDRIQRASLSNPAAIEDIHTSGLDRADAVSVDWINDHVYWVDLHYGHIVISRLDGKLRKTLIKGTRSRGLAVHPLIGWVFFSDYSDSKIEKCGLDGSSRTAIVTRNNTDIDEPNGLAIDLDSNRLYWIDSAVKAIHSCRFDGTDIKLLVKSQEYMPWGWGLTLHKDWLFWTNFKNQSIARVDKATGTNIGFIKTELSLPIGIKVYSSDNQPSVINLCIKESAKCEHLCLPSPQRTVTCACADGFMLQRDGKRCKNIGSGTWLTYTNLKTIERLDMDTNVTQTIAKDVVNAVALDVHYEKGLVYWTDVLTHTISRSKVSRDSMSNKVENIITDKIITPDGLAIDWMYDLLFWTDDGIDHIQVSRLDGTYRKTIIKDTSLDRPRAIAVDPTSGWLFFSDVGEYSRIERCSMNGQNRQIIVDTGLIAPNGISIDHIGKRLYFIDQILHKIESIRFDGTDRFTLITHATAIPMPFGLIVFESNVYWSNWKNKTIFSLNKYGIRDFRKIALYLRSPMGMAMYGESVQPKGQNVCKEDNGGCSHICYPLPAIDRTFSTTSACLCPDRYIMSHNNSTCIKRASKEDQDDSDQDRNKFSDEKESFDGKETTKIIGAVFASAILISIIIFFGNYFRRLRNEREEQRRMATGPNPVYHYVVEKD